MGLLHRKGTARDPVRVTAPVVEADPPPGVGHSRRRKQSLSRGMLIDDLAVSLLTVQLRVPRTQD